MNNLYNNLPQSWRISKYKFHSISGMGTTILQEDLTEVGVPVYSATESGVMFGYLSNPKLLLKKGDLVIPARGNSIGAVKIIEDELATSTQTTIYSKPYNINNKFLYYSCIGLRDEWFSFVQTAIPQITVSQIKNNFLPLPSLQTQDKVVNFLDDKCQSIDDLIKTTSDQIDVLRQYKTSVITETVTKGLDKTVDMKDSGVDWIGHIPRHWQTTKIKHNCYLKGRIGWQGLTASEYIEEGPYLITGTDFKDGIINWDTCVHISEERYKEAYQIQVRNDDLLITKDGTIGKVAIVSALPGKASLNSGVMMIRNNKNKYNNKYLFYVLLSQVFWKWFNSNQRGNSTIIHLYQEQFKDFSFPLPSLVEQSNISIYLEQKCKKVDNLIKLKEDKLEILKEYKKSLIYEYVTGKMEVL